MRHQTKGYRRLYNFCTTPVLVKQFMILVTDFHLPREEVFRRHGILTIFVSLRKIVSIAMCGVYQS